MVRLAGPHFPGRRCDPDGAGGHNNVGVEFKQAVWDETLVDVEACTAFSPSRDVRCEKPCLLLGRFPAAKAEVVAGR